MRRLRLRKLRGWGFLGGVLLGSLAAYGGAYYGAAGQRAELEGVIATYEWNARAYRTNICAALFDGWRGIEQPLGYATPATALLMECRRTDEGPLAVQTIRLEGDPEAFDRAAAGESNATDYCRSRLPNLGLPLLVEYFDVDGAPQWEARYAPGVCEALAAVELSSGEADGP